MARNKKRKGYFGCGKWKSVAMCLLPPLAWILGMLHTLFCDHKIVATIVRIFLGFSVLWLLDLLWMLLFGRVFHFLFVC